MVTALVTVPDLTFLETLAVMGMGGFGLGVGLVLATFGVRAVRAYMKPPDE